MTKPTINSFTAIAPLIIQSYERYLPTAFDESMSILQKMNKIIKQLELIGEVTNEVIEQWNSVMEWVMSEGLTESVSLKLDEMVADGTFDAIINQVIFGDLNQKIDSLKAIPRKRLEEETDDTARLQETLDSLNGNGSLVLNYGETYNVTGLELTGNIQIEGNNAYLNSIAPDNTKPIIKNKEALGTMLTINHVRFKGRNKAIELKLNGASPNVGLSLSMENCRFHDNAQLSTAIDLRQIDFVYLNKLHATNYSTFLNIESDYNLGERDNTQIHLNDIAVLDVKLGCKFKQLDKATINGVDINNCGGGFYFTADNKRMQINACHVEKYGAVGMTGNVGFGYAYYLPENKHQVDITLNNCTSLLPSDNAVAGLFLGDSDTLLTNVILNNCSFAKNDSIPNYKAMILYGSYVWNGRFDYLQNDVTTWRTTSPKINGLIRSTGWEMPSTSNLIPFHKVVDGLEFTTSVGTGTLDVVPHVSDQYDDATELNFTTPTGTNLEKFVTRTLKTGWHTLLFSGFRKSANPFIMVQQLNTPYSNAVRFLPTAQTGILTRIPFYVPNTTTYKIGVTCNENSTLVLSQLELVKGFGEKFTK